MTAILVGQLPHSCPELRIKIASAGVYTYPSFLEYLVVDQDARRVEHYSKQDDGSWVLRDYIGAEASATIARLNAHIPLADLYATAFDLE